MDFTQLINQFGPWAIIVAALVWEAKFTQDQLEKAREDRNLEAERHANEIGNLTEVIQNNTVAVTELTAYIKKEGEESA